MDGCAPQRTVCAGGDGWEPVRTPDRQPGAAGGAGQHQVQQSATLPLQGLEVLYFFSYICMFKPQGLKRVVANPGRICIIFPDRKHFLLDPVQNPSMSSFRFSFIF